MIKSSEEMRLEKEREEAIEARVLKGKGGGKRSVLAGEELATLEREIISAAAALVSSPGARRSRG